MPFANPPALSTVFFQGSNPFGIQDNSGLNPTSTSGIQDAINAKLLNNKRYLESPFSVSVLPDKSYALWINRQVTHALPVAVAWLANNDAAQPFSFTVTSFPLPTPSARTPSAPVGTRTALFDAFALHVLITFFVSVSLATVPCLAIRAVVTDRCAQTKHVLEGSTVPQYQRTTPPRTCQTHLPHISAQSWVYRHPSIGLQTGCLMPLA